MAQQYRYWKTKRHVIHFIVLMVSIFLMFNTFLIDCYLAMGHIDENGVLDPNYESPFTIVVIIMVLLFFFVLTMFVCDLIYYFNVKIRSKKTGNNVEIAVKGDSEQENAAIKDAHAKFMTAGIVADINSQTTELDVEYEFKTQPSIKLGETIALLMYVLFLPLLLCVLVIMLFGIGLNLLVNINDLQGAIVPIIVTVSSALVAFFLFFGIIIFKNNAAKKRAIKTTKETGIRIYKDYVEQYTVVYKDEAEAEIRYKVPFLKAKHLETKKAFFIKAKHNGQIVAIRLNKSEMPEEALILLKNKIKK